MRRIERLAIILALLIVPTTTAPAADPPSPAARVDAFLREWEEHASSITSLDFRFTLTNRSKNWGDEVYEGRALLGLPNQACYELYTPAQRGKSVAFHERLVWTGKVVRQYAQAERFLYEYCYRNEVPDPPAFLSVPFLFQMNAEEAGRRFQWNILFENDSQIMLRATPRSGQSSLFSKDPCVIVLDRRTFLPTRFWIENSPTERQDFAVHSAIPNAPFDLVSFTDPAPAGWRTRSITISNEDWLSKLNMYFMRNVGDLR